MLALYYNLTCVNINIPSFLASADPSVFEGRFNRTQLNINGKPVLLGIIKHTPQFGKVNQKRTSVLVREAAAVN